MLKLTTILLINIYYIPTICNLNNNIDNSLNYKYLYSRYR